MTNPLTPAERKAILAYSGLTEAEFASVTPGDTPGLDKPTSNDDDIEALAHDLDEIGRASVSQEPTSVSAPPVPVADVADVAAPGWAVDEIVKHVLTKAHGDQAKAMALVDGHVQGEFDRIKLSKVQAAVQGLDEAGKREHNANAWKYAQTVGAQIKTGIRKAFRDQGGFVQAKITKGKPSVVDQFIRDNESNDAVQAFLRLMEEGTK